MDKELTLDEMYKGLLEDKQYILKDELRWQWKSFCNGTLRFFVPGGFNEIHLSGLGGEYFAYNHAGSSAVTATKDNLEWILETIFEAKPSNFTELDRYAITDVINEGR